MRTGKEASRSIVNMSDTRKDYSQHVDHPRYGKSPRYTDLDPDPNALGVHLHPNTRLLSADVRAYLKRQFGSWPSSWLGEESRVVPGTAIEADTSRQISRPVQVTHYYDVEKVCRDCGRRFIFFAEEQKYWYEELQFPLESDCVRCCDCRRQLRAIANQKQRYEHLCHVVNRTVEQNLEMAECCLSLVEQVIFHPRQIEHVRQLLNSTPEGLRSSSEYADLRARIGKFENEANPGETLPD
jgi:hypothetical protein